jgi:site-specific recombinase XerD
MRDMKARFYLRNDKVTVYVTIDGVKHRFSTGITCEQKNWVKGYPKRNQTLVIEQIQRIEKPLNEYLATSSIVSPQLIKELINEVMNGKQEDKETIRGLVSLYLSERKDEVSKITYEKIDLHLTNFQVFAGKLIVNDLTPTFFDKYKKHLKKKSLHVNTKNSYIKNVQTFVNWLFKKGYMNRKITLERFEGQQKDIIAITENELQIVTSSNKLSPKHQRVVDLFLFGCYTGLRFSDLQVVNKDLINNEVITIRQQKTGQIVQIPLIYEAQRLLEKYNYQLPQISNQKANEYIKEAFAILKLKRKVYVGNDLKALDEVVSFHVARKSFITIALSKGIHAKIVQAISGHKKDEVFNRYIAFSSATLQSEMQKMSATHLKVVKSA